MNIPVLKRKPIYKVVSIRNRSLVIGRKEIDQRLKKKYARTYKPGMTVYMEPGSYGIFCFTTLEAALRCQENNSRSKIIKVRPIGRKLPTPDIVPELYRGWKYVEQYYRDVLSWARWTVPHDTACYSAVEVIDER